MPRKALELTAVNYRGNGALTTPGGTADLASSRRAPQNFAVVAHSLPPYAVRHASEHGNHSSRVASPLGG